MEVHISKILCMSNIASTTVIEKQKCMCAYTYEPGDNAEPASPPAPNEVSFGRWHHVLASRPTTTTGHV